MRIYTLLDLPHSALRLAFSLAFLALVGCHQRQNTFDALDHDDDGFADPAAEDLGFEDPFDCDDQNADIHPGATELCNGIDDDCDGDVDEPDAADAATWYADSDGDGYGDPSATQNACAQPALFVSNNLDCDDADARTNPDSLWYADADGDGFGDVDDAGTPSCENPGEGAFVQDDSDCNDGSAEINRDAEEIVNDGTDQDCDGIDACARDGDGDGYGGDLIIDSDDLDCTDDGEASGLGSDCDDSAANINPDAAELCDQIDQNCDGAVDEGLAYPQFLDVDEDGYGDNGTAVSSCDPISGRIELGGDCNDTQELIHPGAVEQTADGVDADCDGGDLCWADADLDGFGSTSMVQSLINTTCDSPGESDISTDCDDANDGVYPGATEVCDLVDGNCDGIVDTDVMTTFYRDADGDGFGGTDTQDACTLPSGFTTTSTDCDDTRVTVFPGAAEVCNGLDEDCDNVIDDGVLITFYADADGDGFAPNGAASTQACNQPSGYAPDTGPTEWDCDDTASWINASELEHCNHVDDNCNGFVDESSAVEAGTWYYDSDSDGYGDSGSAPTIACSQPAHYSAVPGDCNDGAPNINPGAYESNSNGNCSNNIDDDCDGNKDAFDRGC